MQKNLVNNIIQLVVRLSYSSAALEQSAEGLDEKAAVAHRDALNILSHLAVTSPEKVVEELLIFPRGKMTFFHFES